MNQLKVFENSEFGPMRTIAIDGEPWFVGKDVALALGYSNASKAVMAHVDEDDKRFEMLRVMDSQNGNLVKTAVINESGVYSLIFGSKLPSAKEFKHWVTSEVLPSFRKHGGYMIGQEEWTREELLAKSLLYANSVMEERAARIEELEAETQAQAEQLAITEPKAEYYDAFVDARTSTNFRTTAKEIGVGERKLIGLLIDKGFLFRDKQGELLPYSVRNRGFFIVRDVATGHWMGKQTFVTEKGKQHFRSLCQKEGLISSDQSFDATVLPVDTYLM